MGTNEKILIGSLVLAAGVAGFIYVQRKGGIKNLLNPTTNDKPTNSTQQAAYTAPVRVNPNFTTPTSVRTRTIQELLAEGGYLSASDIDGKWGAKTDSAFRKATAEKNLIPITNESSYLTWVRNFRGTGTNSSSSSGNLREIARLINQEFRSMTTNYGLIRDKLKPLTAAQIKEIDRIYREFSPNGLAKDFRDDDAGGKVASVTYNVTAIRDILSDAGLKGLAQIEILAGIV